MIPIALPFLGEEEAEAARDAVLSGWVSQGPTVAAFEREFAALVEANHATAVSNCTTALHLALKAIGVKQGDEVITASHSFIATANCIRYLGADPIFVDIDRDTYNIDPICVEQAITPKTKAILAVHQMGLPCDLTKLLALGEKYGVRVVEDAACAAGSQLQVGEKWEYIGKPHGDVACFSFHPRKVITTGEGGMITTRIAELDQRFRLLRQHGMSVPDTVRHASAKVVFEEYVEVGFNYRMTDIQAAIGRKQLPKLRAIVERRRAVAQRYAELLGNIEGLELPYEPSWAKSNWQSFCIRLPDHVDQKTVMQSLLDQGIATRRGIMCSHREPAYDDCSIRHELSVSEEAQDRTILLPIYAQMTEQDVETVARSLVNELRK